MFFRRARADRAFREAQRAGYELLKTHAEWPLPGPAADAETPAAPQTPPSDFLPPDLRVPSRQDVAGLMVRWLQPLVVDGEIRPCPECGAYRDSPPSTTPVCGRRRP